MDRNEIAELLLSEDKIMVGIKHEADASYIKKLLNGSRKVNSERSKAIMKDLEMCAQLNKENGLTKATILQMELLNK